MINKKPENIDSYIAAFPTAVQTQLKQIRSFVRAAAPEAQETIKYGMPTFTLSGNLVFFAAFKNHIGFYALPSGNAAFQKELSVYKTGKGSIQFPIDQPLPAELITRIVQLRIKENLEKVAKGK